MHRVALLLIVGCASGGPPSTDRPINNAKTTTTDGVLVRFANRGEFPESAQPGTTRRSNRLGKDCHLTGPATRSYLKPVIAFAREYLAEGYSGSDVHDFFVAPGQKPSLGDGVNIVAELRPLAGELQVLNVGPPFYRSGTTWSGHTYCLHVLQQGRETIIVVDHSSMWIR